MMPESLLPHLLLTLWLLPCALFDLRGRRVPNWLTLPALPLALWWAVANGTFALALTVLVASFLAFLSGGMGGADGKMAIVQAAISPPALLVTGILLLLTFLGLRLRHNAQRRLPAGLWFFAGSLIFLTTLAFPLCMPGDIP